MKYMFNIPTKNHKCNLNCDYCIIKEQDKEKSFERNFSIEDIKEFIKFHTDIKNDEILINFGGSEPFTNDNLDETIKLFEFVKEYNLSLSVLTNGIQNTNTILKYKDLLNKNRKRSGKVCDLIITFHRTIVGDIEGYYENLIKKLTNENINLIFQEVAINGNIKKSKIFLDKMKEKYNIHTKFVTLRAWGSESWSKEKVKEYYNDFKSDKELGDKSQCTKDLLNEYCSCFKGYDSYHILMNGDIIKCWYNQCIIGDLHDNILRKDIAIKRDFYIKNDKLKERHKIVENVNKEKMINNEQIDLELINFFNK